MIKKFVDFGTELIKGYEVASFPFTSKNEAYRELRAGNYPTDIYSIHCVKNNEWYIMSKKPQ